MTSNKHPIHIGIRVLPINDLAFNSQIERAMAMVDNLEPGGWTNDINEVIDLYNAQIIITTDGVNPNIADERRNKIEHINTNTGKYFSQIGEDNLGGIYSEVSLFHIDDFWSLFEKYKVFQRISAEAFKNFLENTSENENILSRILKHKVIVKSYDALLADVMRQSNPTEPAEVIIHRFLEDKPSESFYMPKALKPFEYENILQSYVGSESPNIGLLQVIAQAQSTRDCPVSDELRLHAKRKYNKFWETRLSNDGGVTFCTSVSFADIDAICECKSATASNLIRQSNFEYIYDKKWILGNLDYPTLFNNFIYLFEYVDRQGRCLLPSFKNSLSIFERTLGVHGNKEYSTGIAFDIYKNKSALEMRAYIDLLKSQNIDIDDMLRWFCMDYLSSEFGADGFVYNMTSADSTLVVKCRNLASEMDALFKQYTFYIRDGVIDRELYEISSQMVAIDKLPSYIERKYAYCTNANLETEMNMLFSDQCLLSYVPRLKKEYNAFYKLLLNETVSISDYKYPFDEQIRWLIKRGSIYQDRDGTLKYDKSRANILMDLYYKEAICPFHYEKDHPVIKQLYDAGEIEFKSTLFSKSEADFYNFMLNRSEFSNGYDLRNKYVHGTNSQNSTEQLSDYLELLKLMIVAVIKINEEFCYREDVLKPKEN